MIETLVLGCIVLGVLVNMIVRDIRGDTKPNPKTPILDCLSGIRPRR